jgi:hypothetical protein
VQCCATCLRLTLGSNTTNCLRKHPASLVVDIDLQHRWVPEQVVAERSDDTVWTEQGRADVVQTLGTRAALRLQARSGKVWVELQCARGHPSDEVHVVRQVFASAPANSYGRYLPAVSPGVELAATASSCM